MQCNAVHNAMLHKNKMTSLIQSLSKLKQSSPILPNLLISGTYVESILDNINISQEKWGYGKKSWKGHPALNKYFFFVIDPSNNNSLDPELDYLIIAEDNHLNVFCNKYGVANISEGGIVGNYKKLFEEVRDSLNLKLMVEFDASRIAGYKGAKFRYYAIDYLDNLTETNLCEVGTACNPVDAVSNIFNKDNK
jgi:hypothetical protein